MYSDVQVTYHDDCVSLYSRSYHFLAALVYATIYNVLLNMYALMQDCSSLHCDHIPNISSSWSSIFISCSKILRYV